MVTCHHGFQVLYRPRDRGISELISPRSWNRSHFRVSGDHKRKSERGIYLPQLSLTSVDCVTVTVFFYLENSLIDLQVHMTS